MSTITGLLTDAGLSPFQGRFPRLKFRPVNATTADAHVVTREPVDAVINDGTGEFSVTVVSSDETTPPTRYTVTADWDSGRELDVIQGLYVPAGNWNLSDLILATAPPSVGMVMYGFGPPPPGLTNVLYVDISGSKPVLYAPENGGIG
ncbi:MULTISPECIES: hypothetical protein [unclassified Microbacterium]|uniref:hypothetical protein n=1 Tax=unclassified Microbacterium TaxID=2609290 RepID=UPI0016050CAC|nr:MULTISPECIES: hypothetical protein [unclassified Microbacterium]QNA93273.1 hypothetical protein G4G29_14815 [Microbacterium sp. Se63.02b]QYM63483.1 hypothetical protein K1X59_14865 [Microbacterium sp. Se5.02b]